APGRVRGDQVGAVSPQRQQAGVARHPEPVAAGSCGVVTSGPKGVKAYVGSEQDRSWLKARRLQEHRARAAEGVEDEGARRGTPEQGAGVGKRWMQCALPGAQPVGSTVERVVSEPETQESAAVVKVYAPADRWVIVYRVRARQKAST